MLLKLLLRCAVTLSASFWFVSSISSVATTAAAAQLVLTSAHSILCCRGTSDKMLTRAVSGRIDQSRVMLAVAEANSRLTELDFRQL
jgi:hypothetical protein